MHVHVIWYATRMYVHVYNTQSFETSNFSIARQAEESRARTVVAAVFTVCACGSPEHQLLAFLLLGKEIQGPGEGYLVSFR